MPLGPHFGAKKWFRSHFGRIWAALKTPGDPQMGPRKAWNPFRSVPNPAQEPNQQSAFNRMLPPSTHYPINQPGGMRAAIKSAALLAAAACEKT